MKYIFVLIFSAFAFSQNPTAKSAEGFAIEKVSRLTNPQLYFIGSTLGQKFDITEVLSVTTNVNFDSGGANFWIVGYYEDDDESKIEIVPVIVNPQSKNMIDLRSIIPNIEDQYTNVFNFPKITITDWVDSDVFLDKLQNNSSYQSLSGQYSKGLVNYLGVIQIEDPSASFSDAFWTIDYYSEDKDKIYECFMGSKNQLIECKDSGINKVFDLGNLDVRLGPNPSNDFINIEMNEIGKPENISLHNIIGNQISNFKYDLTGNNLRLNISNLNTGNYILSFKINGKIYTTRIVKI